MIILVCTQATDLLKFTGIMALIIVSYGVALQALLFPASDLSPELIVKVLYKPYWQIYGELFLQDIEGEVVSNES